MKESDLYKPVKEWLIEQGYTDIYPEVQPAAYTKRADIIAVQNQIITAVELKVGLNLEVIEQAAHWRRYCNYAFVAIKKPVRFGATTGAHLFGRNLLYELGIGLLYVPTSYYDPVKLEIRPKINRKADKSGVDWMKVLRDDLKYGPQGGSKAGGQLTPYRRQMNEVRRAIEFLTKYVPGNKEGVSISSILEQVKTHYANPAQSLAAALLKFESNWCEPVKIGRKTLFRIKEGVEL